MTDKASFGRRARARAPAIQPAAEAAPAAELSTTRFKDVSSGTPGAGLGVSVQTVQTVLWGIAAVLGVAFFLVPEHEHRQWIVWGFYTLTGLSVLNGIWPRKKS